MIELPRFTVGPLQRIFKATGKNMLGAFDPNIIEDLDFWEKALNAVDPAKAADWLESFTIPELFKALIADTRGSLRGGNLNQGGDATADATKSA